MKKITIRTPEDIIETAVDMLGYRPEDSLVLLGIMDPNTEGPGLGVLRIDYSTAAALGFADGSAGDVVDLVHGLGSVKPCCQSFSVMTSTTFSDWAGR